MPREGGAHAGRAESLCGCVEEVDEVPHLQDEVKEAEHIVAAPAEKSFRRERDGECLKGVQKGEITKERGRGGPWRA